LQGDFMLQRRTRTGSETCADSGKIELLRLHQPTGCQVLPDFRSARCQIMSEPSQ
jgi:hypothetical protein